MKIKIECKVASESYDDLNIFRLLFKEVAMSIIDEAFPVRSAFAYFHTYTVMKAACTRDLHLTYSKTGVNQGFV